MATDTTAPPAAGRALSESFQSLQDGGARLRALPNLQQIYTNAAAEIGRTKANQDLRPSVIDGRVKDLAVIAEQAGDAWIENDLPSLIASDKRIIELRQQAGHIRQTARLDRLPSADAERRAAIHRSTATGLVALAGIQTEPSQLAQAWTEIQLTESEDAIRTVARALSARLGALNYENEAARDLAPKTTKERGEAAKALRKELEAWQEQHPSASDRLEAIAAERRLIEREYERAATTYRRVFLERVDPTSFRPHRVQL